MVNIEEFISKITIYDYVKEHLKQTTSDFLEYLGKLTTYDQKSIDAFLYDLLVKESINSSKLERELFSPEVIKVYDSLFCNSDLINKDILFKMHEAVMDKNTIEHRKGGTYREHQVWIGNPNEGIEYAFHIPPNYTEIEKYMNDFIEYYNNNDNLNDPFIKSAIIHILIIKIHPYADGNGRMARILQNHKLKSLINNKYNLKLKYPPINISKSYDLTRLSYFTKQNDIKFDLNTDNNDAFNEWFDYVLLMFDEQIFYANNRLEEYDEILKSDLNNKFNHK